MIVVQSLFLSIYEVPVRRGIEVVWWWAGGMQSYIHGKPNFVLFQDCVFVKGTL